MISRKSTRTARGKAIVNLLNLNNERVTAVIPVREFSPERFLFFATQRGQVLKVSLEELSRPTVNRYQRDQPP